jgi:hypothetical protein
MRQEMIEWIYSQLSQEREEHGGEFILVCNNQGNSGAIIIECTESFIASVVHHLSKELSKDTLAALILNTLNEAVTETKEETQ